MNIERMVERIDGTDYVIGTPEHAMARRARTARMDAAYVEAHHHLLERNLRMLRGWDELDHRIRTDANASAFLARDLVHVRAQIERTIYERLRAAEFVPVEEGHPPGAESYETRRMDIVGEAKISHDLAGDAPRADTAVEADLRKYVYVRSSYAYTTADLERAAFANVPLPRWKADACADVIARGLDRIGRSGDALSGLKGFFNSTDVTVHTLTNGEWGTATVAELLADLAEIEQTIIAACGDNLPPGEKPFRLVLPSTYEGRLKTLAKDVTSDVSVANFFLANSRIIGSIERYGALDSAVSPDVAAADAPMGICYARSPETLFWPIPIVYDEQQPQLAGWEWITQARARAGGVDFRRPFWALYVQNLD